MKVTDKKDKTVSMAVIRRLPKYHRYLKDLMDKGVIRISSKSLSKLIGFTASQIRQDLNNFGGFGQQGYGYTVEDLYREIGKILGLTRQYNVVIVGAGNLGQALANYSRFSKIGFNLKALFDIKKDVVGTCINGVDVLDNSEFVQFAEAENIEIAYICTGRDNAQDVANMIQKTKIKAIWNFAPVDIKVKPEIYVENINLVDNLLTLLYFIKD